MVDRLPSDLGYLPTEMRIKKQNTGTLGLHRMQYNITRMCERPVRLDIMAETPVAKHPSA
jgi:hypothetical protein